jgi:hypothetical protein
MGGSLGIAMKVTFRFVLTRNVCRAGKSKIGLCLRDLLNRPQRERLSCFKVGILMVGKVKPTIAIAAKVRLIVSEIEFVECAFVVFADLNSYKILICQPIDK